MFAAAILALFAAPVAGVVPPAAVRAGPADRFAADVTARASAGHRLRGLEVDREDDSLVLSLVLAGDGDAARFALRYTADGRHVVGYQSEAVAAPVAARVYAVEDRLLASLEEAAPGPLYDDGPVFGLEQPGGVIYLDPDGYYVVERRFAGAGADAALVEIMRDALDADGDLIEMTSSDGVAGRVVDLTFDGDERRIVHVGTDSRGHVTVVEERRSPPSGYVYQRYRFPQLLRSLLRAGGAMHSLRLEARPDGDARLVGALRGGARLIIDQADFESEEMEPGC
jgi:hypothetical protein